MTTGEKIAALRRGAGLSQETLAGRLGVSRQAVSRWETNESLPDTDKIIQLSRLLNVSTDYLLLEDCRPPEPPDASPMSPVRLWSRRFCIALAALGTALSLLGLAAAVLWAVRTDRWYTDFGRFGTALFFQWPGSVLLGGLLVLVLALLLALVDRLLAAK